MLAEEPRAPARIRLLRPPNRSTPHRIDVPRSERLHRDDPVRRSDRRCIDRGDASDRKEDSSERGDDRSRIHEQTSIAIIRNGRSARRFVEPRRWHG
jgi:hypothetical protein